MGQDNPGKVFYRVGEVSQKIGVESYVLRYWEKMFPQLKPEKDESGQRVYTQADIDVVSRIKNLLHEQRYTIDGARKKLREESKTRDSGDISELQTTLEKVKSILREVSARLEDKK